MKRLSRMFMRAIVGFVVATVIVFSSMPRVEAQLGILSSPFGGKILTVLPNPPPTPATPNPCFFPGSYLLTIGPPSPGEYVLKIYINVINGINPPTPGVWSLGLAGKGAAGPCPVITLIGVSGIF